MINAWEWADRFALEARLRRAAGWHDTWFNRGLDLYALRGAEPPEQVAAELAAVPTAAEQDDASVLAAE